MRILFIYKYKDYEPLGLMTLSAFLKNQGHQCIYIDTKFEVNLIKQVKNLAPDIIAYSILTGNHLYFRDINLKLKRHLNFLAVFGGPHCTLFPEFINEDGVDIISRGESEEAILDLVNRLMLKKDITNIPNLYVKQNEKIYKNEMAPLCLDLDSIPFPDRDLVNVYKHYKKMRRRDVISLRGCPYQCTYCYNHAFKDIYRSKGKYVRHRSVDNVIAELKILKVKYNTKVFHFQDDLFTMDKAWTLQFCKMFKDEIGLRFEIQVRVNHIDEEIVIALKDAGCVWALYGIETGNINIRKELLQRDITDDQIIEVSKLFHKHKIRTMSVNMLGLPEESFENTLETLNINIKCMPNYAWNSIYQPYPKTQLAQYSIEKGYFKGNENDFKESFLYGKSKLSTTDIKRIVRFHYLFSLAVSMPKLKRFFVFLTLLPLNKAYQMLFFLHRVYAAFFSLKRVNFSEIFVFEISKYFFIKRKW